MVINTKLSNEPIRALQEIDELTIRPLRAILSNKGTQDDIDRLAQLEELAEEYRTKISNEKKCLNDFANCV